MSKNIKKILVLLVIFIMLTGGVIYSAKQNVKNYTIVFPDGTELKVFTKSADPEKILEENNIYLLENEEIRKEALSENKILIENKEETEEKVIEKKIISVEKKEMDDSKVPIFEKILNEKVEIPFKTVTKTAKGYTSGERKSEIIKNGVPGLKEVKYRAKYKDDVLIEKEIISEKIIKNAEDKIVLVSQKNTYSGSLLKNTGNTWEYDDEGMRLLYAITCQESSSSYEGSLAVISSATNRATSSRWRRHGTDPLSQYKAKNQYCYSIDKHWVKYYENPHLVPEHVKRAVNDALKGTVNHNFTSFRSSWTGVQGVTIGGNTYFNPK